MGILTINNHTMGFVKEFNEFISKSSVIELAVLIALHLAP